MAGRLVVEAPGTRNSDRAPDLRPMDENADTPEAVKSTNAHPTAIQDVANDVMLYWRRAPLFRDRFEVVMGG